VFADIACLTAQNYHFGGVLFAMLCDIKACRHKHWNEHGKDKKLRWHQILERIWCHLHEIIP